jgi:hypothetical protein
VTLDVLPGSFAICQLTAGAAVPEWAWRSNFSSVTRTPDELSIVCAVDDVPAGVVAQRDYRGLMVRGPLDFSDIGIVAALASPLAAAAISIFVVSSYETDYLLVLDHHFNRAIAVLRDAGHRVVTGA